ncbi:MAG: hypothetical protein V1854_05020, partial [Methanobacteriota archaeon]
AIKAENSRIEADRRAREDAEEKIRRAEREAIEVERRALEAEKAKLEAQKVAELERKDREESERQERIKAIETQRYNGLLSVGYQYPEIDLGTITESEYQELYQRFKAIWDKEQEAKRIEAEEKAARERVEFERIATEKAEREAKEKQEQEEVELKARAEAEAVELARKEALRPDKEKLMNFASDLLDLNFPDLSDINSIKILDRVKEMLTEVRRYISSSVNEF